MGCSDNCMYPPTISINDNINYITISCTCVNSNYVNMLGVELKNNNNDIIQYYFENKKSYKKNNLCYESASIDIFNKDYFQNFISSGFYGRILSQNNIYDYSDCVISY